MVRRRVGMFRGPGAVRQRRKLVWATRNIDFGPVAAGATTNVDLLADFRAAGAFVIGCTIMRTHLGMHVQSTALTDSYEVGLVVGRLGDVATNRISVNADPEIDWMYVNRWWAPASGAAVDAGEFHEIDLRAKRKLQELDQAYLFVFTNQTAAAHTPHLFVRTLVALP